MCVYIKPKLIVVQLKLKIATVDDSRLNKPLRKPSAVTCGLWASPEPSKA